MKHCKIKDNSGIKKDNLSKIPNLVSKISDKTLEQLEKEGIFVFPNLVKDSEDITRDQMILQSVNDTYRTSNVMGFLGYDDERLVIESRFSRGSDDFFFQYLLDSIVEIPNIVDLKTEVNQDNQLFNFFIFIFPYYLRTAVRKGIFKTYINNQYNDDNVRGIIDISRHISENTPFLGNIAYSQREYSYDNYLIELIRHTIEFIKRKKYGNSILVNVKNEVKQIVNATPHYNVRDRQKVIIENKQNIIRHAYYREYRFLQQLCLLILQYQNNQFGFGIRKMYGLLFDGAWLWEEYINSLVKNLFYHPENKGHKGAQRLFAGNKGLIYPDFISKTPNQRIIADAKYKPVDNIGNKDYLQVLAYMFRFDAKIGFYFYPETNNLDKSVFWLNKGSSYEDDVEPREDIRVVKLGLKIPTDANNYPDFVEQMKISEKNFIELLIESFE